MKLIRKRLAGYLRERMKGSANFLKWGLLWLLNFWFVGLIFWFWIEQIHALGHTAHRYSLLALWLNDNSWLGGFPAMLAATQLIWFYREDLPDRDGARPRTRISAAATSFALLLSAAIGLWLIRNDLYAIEGYSLESPFALTAAPLLTVFATAGLALLWYAWTGNAGPLLPSGMLIAGVHLYWFTSPYYYMAAFTDSSRYFKPAGIFLMSAVLLALFGLLAWSLRREPQGRLATDLPLVVPVFQLIVMASCWTAASVIIPHHHLCLHDGDLQRVFSNVISAVLGALLVASVVFRNPIRRFAERFA